MTRPYYYRIKDKETNIYYIGCKFGEGCSPETFWVDYFTSSDEIRSLDKSRFEVCKVVEMEDPLSYETKVLRKLDCAGHPLFYNKHNNNFGDVHPTSLPKVKKQMTEKMTKTKNSVEWKETTGKVVREKLSKFMKEKCSSEDFDEIDKERRQNISDFWKDNPDYRKETTDKVNKTIRSEEYQTNVEPERIRKIKEKQHEEYNRKLVQDIRDLLDTLYPYKRKKITKELGIKRGWYRKNEEKLSIIKQSVIKWISENG